MVLLNLLVFQFYFLFLLKDGSDRFSKRICRPTNCSANKFRRKINFKQGINLVRMIKQFFIFHLLVSHTNELGKNWRFFWHIGMRVQHSFRCYNPTFCSDTAIHMYSIEKTVNFSRVGEISYSLGITMLTRSNSLSFFVIHFSLSDERDEKFCTGILSSFWRLMSWPYQFTYVGVCLCLDAAHI